MDDAAKPKWAREPDPPIESATAQTNRSEPADPTTSKPDSVPQRFGPRRNSTEPERFPSSYSSAAESPPARGVVAKPEAAATTRSIAPVFLAALLGAAAAGLVMFFVMRGDQADTVTAEPTVEEDRADLAGPDTSSDLSIEIDRQTENDGAGIGEAASPSESNQSETNAAPTTTGADAPTEAAVAATCRLNLLAGTVDETSLVCSSGTVEISGSIESWHNDVSYLVLDEGVVGQLEFEPQSSTSPPPLPLAAGANTPDAQATRYGTNQLTINFTEADQHVHIYSEPNRQGRELTLHFRP